MRKNLLFTLMLAVVGFVGCKKADISNSKTSDGIAPGGCFPPTTDCRTVLCTTQFAEVVLDVKDAGGTAVTLDSFVVTDLSGSPLPPSSAGTPVYGYPQSGNGRYSVINDAWLAGHWNSSASVRAIGFMNGVQVFNEPYTIVADCCHVSKQSGKDAIIIP